MTQNLTPTLLRDVAIGPLDLECGERLNDVVLSACLYGDPASDGSNVVFVPHALTGSGRLTDWWGGFIGPGRALDTDRVALLGLNVLGGCYGSTGPSSLAADGRRYGSRFPVIAVGDMVRAHQAAVRELGFERMAGVIGGSLGAMQGLQWILMEPEAFRHGFILGATDHLSSMNIALNSLSRNAILRDPNYAGGDYSDERPPHEGLRLAREIAMVTYKNKMLFAERFGRNPDRAGGNPRREKHARFDVEAYLDYQGRKFVDRMDANTYLCLTRAMDLFDLREDVAAATSAKLTFVGITSDWLFSAEEIRATAERFRERGFETAYAVMNSTHGHDAFLADLPELASLIAPGLERLYSEL